MTTTASEIVRAAARYIVDAGEDDDKPPGSGEGPRAPTADRRAACLLGALERQVIPRLVLAHGRDASWRPGPARSLAPQPEDVADLVRGLLGPDDRAALGQVRALESRGVPVPTLLLDLLAPAARELGWRWETDQCGFADVTIGLCRLHAVLRALTADAPRPARAGAPARRMLLLPAPGEQHMFGIFVLAELLLDAGWAVTCGPAETLAATVQRVVDDPFEVVGLSASTDAVLEPLPHQIRELRRASQNPALVVLVGGRSFTGRADLAAAVGADGTDDDPARVARLAERLVAR